jgi:hypothetical protein
MFLKLNHKSNSQRIGNSDAAEVKAITCLDWENQLMKKQKTMNFDELKQDSNIEPSPLDFLDIHNDWPSAVDLSEEMIVPRY